MQTILRITEINKQIIAITSTVNSEPAFCSRKKRKEMINDSERQRKLAVILFKVLPI